MDDNKGLDHWREFGDHLPGQDDCWGLFAAQLGNAQNRKSFWEAFGPTRKKAESSTEPKFMQWLEKLAGSKKSRIDEWESARRRFLSQVERVERLRGKAVRYEELQAKLPHLEADRDRVVGDCDRLEDVRRRLSQNRKKLTDETDGLKARVEEISESLHEWEASRPGWWRRLMVRLTGGAEVRAWDSRYVSLMQRLEAAEAKYETACDEVEQETRKYEGVTQQVRSKREYIAARNGDLRLILNELQVLRCEISALPDYDVTTTPLNDPGLQNSGLWNEWKALADERANLFVAACEVHRAFVANCAREVRSNLKTVRAMQHGTIAPPKGAEDAWATFFLVVPVVSSTFASFHRNFGSLPEKGLGCVLIDEAGQALPRSAVGAMQISNQAIVVGDPMQLEPIEGMPEVALRALAKQVELPRRFQRQTLSCQDLADRWSSLGSKRGESWVGCPLRVHRRCLEPMFSVANEIAYGGTMIHAKALSSQKPGFRVWYHHQGGPFDGHASLNEVEHAVLLVKAQLHSIDSRDLDGVLVISPFRTVISKFIRKLREQSDHRLDVWADRENSQKPSNFGTIHTFQGREADVVILLLGGAPSSAGALAWASEKPNLLNVAMTRARRGVIVIGDRCRWAELAFFEVAARKLGERDGARDLAQRRGMNVVSRP